MTNDEQLTVDLWLLDAIFTGKDSRSGRGDEDLIVNLEKFIFGELFYLSDSGYSRVYYSLADRDVFLASESRQEVRTLWDCDAARTIKRRITRLVDRWVKEQEVAEAKPLCASADAKEATKAIERVTHLLSTFSESELRILLTFGGIVPGQTKDIMVEQLRGRL